jgi:hypothetical protein
MIGDALPAGMIDNERTEDWFKSWVMASLSQRDAFGIGSQG